MRRILNILLVTAGVVILFGMVTAIVVRSWLVAPLPDHDGTVDVPQLDNRVEIIRDSSGIPHIYASTVHDLRFAQGYVQAQDRWWQMEFARHIGKGRIQELTGRNASLMSTDVFIRTVGWERAAQRDLDALPDAVRAELQAFADGVNAYIQSRSANQLALEYRILGLTGVEIDVEAWTPLDTLVWTKVMAWDLSGNRSGELFRSRLLSSLDADLVDSYIQDFPYDTHATIVTEADVPASGTFGDPVDTAGIIGADVRFAGNLDIDTGFLFGHGEGIGSNNWVVSGDLTASGAPLLADDPHLGIQMPSIWYEIGLYCQPVSDDCPYQVRGFAFPASPLVILGHNDRIAWGVTTNTWDTQDLYRITVNPDNPLQYEYDGEWRDMTMHEETLFFGDDAEPVTLTVRETHFGPIMTDNVIDDETGALSGLVNDDNVFAMRWTAYEPSTLVQALIQLNQAQNWDDFRVAMAYWDSPSQNFVYADVDGNIGYQTPGNVPIRARGHTGMLPVDGSTSQYEWLGYVPYEYLPSVLNPERGYIQSANQATVPLAYYEYLRAELGDQFGDDAHYRFGYNFAAGYRGQRLVEMLEATDQHTPLTFAEIQGDNKMLVAEAIAPYLAAIDMGSADANDMRDWMLDWDYQLHMDSPQAALFVHVWLNLMDAIYEDQLADDGTPSGTNANMWTTTVLLEQPDNPWWDDVTTPATVETRDDILRTAFITGYDATVARLGADRTAWAWGDLHVSNFISNPLGASGITVIENLFNITDRPTSGGAATLNATRWRSLEDFEVASVPSMRMIVDFSDFGNNLSIHTTGQSGHPMSPHYNDMVDEWRNIDYRPMLFDRQAILDDAAATLILQPTP